jgi:ubiquinone/menaquinone biosynthesis C-methylase UbiE
MKNISETIQRYLACPNCHGRLIIRNDSPQCLNCPFTGQIQDNVVVMMDRQPSFFDEPFTDRKDSGDHSLALFRLQQEQILNDYLKSGAVVCDVGCGRSLQYNKPADCFVIGIDPSFSSIKGNRDVDLNVLGTALALPIPSKSVDVLLCFYSVHHMVGNTMNETCQNVVDAFQEFARVLKPDGTLLIFDVSPWLVSGLIQRSLWNYARKGLGSKLDMYLWPSKALMNIGQHAMPTMKVAHKTLHLPALKMLSPFLAFPQVKVPRFLIPVDVSVYQWRF